MNNCFHDDMIAEQGRITQCLNCGMAWKFVEGTNYIIQESNEPDVVGALTLPDSVRTFIKIRGE